MSASSDALEELSALKAIYDNELVCTDEPNGVHAPWLRHKEIDALYTKLEETATSSIGSPVVYSLVENIRDFLDEPHLRNSRKTVDPTIVKRPAVEEPSYSKSSTLPSVKVHLSMAPAFLSIAQGFQCPEIYHGESIVDRKSVFQVIFIVLNLLDIHSC
ncbi:unnamed protein product [Protopolystoma xenopodis]|uniref:Uncharacterized protein n=1 Tax=Protopolystoma xenopodis TaxID=117903 RepID=A0A3S5ART1_9PLAT|nr:unnamed protein product [Protopolystoma xenopodis]